MDHDAANTVVKVIDLLPAEPSDQATVTVNVLMLVELIGVTVRVRLNDTPLRVIVAFPLKQLLLPPAGTAPALV